MFVVTVQLPDGRTAARTLDHGRCIVGRFWRSDRGADDLQVDDTQVSNEHAVLGETAGQLTITALATRNGTFLGGEPLAEHVPHPLPLDEPVSIGASLLTVRYTAGIEETRKEQPPFATKYLGVLYSDMVSGTRQNVALGQDQALELLLWHHTMLRERVKRFGGKVTKNRGDGFEATFATVNAALGCAAACQRELSRHNAAVGPELQVHVRMGVNGGEAPYVAGTAYGLPLILAARVMDQAQARQVLVPAHVLDTLLGTRYEFSSVGVRDLKGLAKPVELFAFHWWRDPYAARPTGPL